MVFGQHIFAIREGMNDSLLVEHVYLALICIPSPPFGTLIVKWFLYPARWRSSMDGFDGDVPEEDISGLQDG